MFSILRTHLDHAAAFEDPALSVSCGSTAKIDQGMWPALSVYPMLTFMHACSHAHPCRLNLAARRRASPCRLQVSARPRSRKRSRVPMRRGLPPTARARP
eukprot:366004-Chlamydomonas_euryale.AAC.8